MEKIARQKLKIISSLLSCVLCLFSMVSLTLSWFAHNDNTSSDGFNINTANVDGGIKLEYCHSYSYAETGGIVKNDMIATPSVEMKGYDWVLTDKNDNTPLILRVIVSNVSASLKVTVSVTRDTWSYWGTSAEDKDKIMSNVLSVKVGYGWEKDGAKDSYNPTDNASDSTTSIYNGVKDFMSSASSFTAKTFVYQENNSYKKNTSLSFSLTGYDNYLCSVGEDGSINYSAETKNALVFYIMFDYDTDLINGLKDALGTSTAEKVDFRSDISSITIE